MKPTLVLLLILLLLRNVSAQMETRIVTKDINNFWKAYDLIRTTTDTALQRRFIDDLFISKATPGLKAIMEVRDYTAQSYLDAIRKYPRFWQSIRSNTLKADNFSTEIQREIARLRQFYPTLKPAMIYFTMGALMTNGTTQTNRILIGSELALADSTANTSEFSAPLNHLKQFFKSNPIQSVVFGNVHEYVHTQQKTTLANSLLGQCIIEGVAEFMAVKATGKPSPTPALTYGPLHDSQIKAVFAEQMFNPGNSFWLYSNQSNKFGMRDLGYYVGYTICEKFYKKAVDKRQAIKTMIELNYNDQSALENFVDRSGYFELPLATYHQKYEAARPTVTSITEIKNQSSSVSTTVNKLTVNFSTPMNPRNRGFDFGPLGEGNTLKLKRYIGFSEDGKSVSFEVELKPDFHYQLLLTDKFQDMNGRTIKPYLIEFTTIKP